MPTNRLWLIDGHNLIFAVPSLRELQVSDRREEARRALVDRLQRFAHARGEEVRVVFDGNQLASNPDSIHEPLLEITYTRRGDEIADERIIYIARTRAGKRHPVTVVTNDVSTLASRLPRGVDHLGVQEFWLKHIEKKPSPGGKQVEGDFSDVESELLEYSAAEEASAARAAETSPSKSTQDPADRHTRRQDRPPSTEAARRELLRRKRERGRLRQQRRLKRAPKPGRR